MSIQADESFQYLKYHLGAWEPVESKVASEAPVSLTVNGEVWLTFLCTPTHLEALAAGFLYNEGLVETADEIASLTVCASGDNVDAWLIHTAERPPQWQRTTGCSGGATAGQAAVHLPAGLNLALTPAQVANQMEMLLACQELYHAARGVHASALVEDGQVIAQAEDIGRHNTLDKIAGQVLLSRRPLKARSLLTTGRVSSEMLQKAARLGAVIVISRTSPNALSIRQARQAGITLVGYARKDGFQVYTHPERIAGAPSAPQGG